MSSQRGGGAHPLHPPPGYAPAVSRRTQFLSTRKQVNEAYPVRAVVNFPTMLKLSRSVTESRHSKIVTK